LPSNKEATSKFALCITPTLVYAIPNPKSGNLVGTSRWFTKSTSKPELCSVTLPSKTSVCGSPKMQDDSEWRLANGEMAVFLEGSAPALPKKFCCPEIALRTLHLAPDFDSPVGSPSQKKNAE